MLERTILGVHVEDPGSEEAARIRERLKVNFPAGAARRMTLLGMMVGSAVRALGPAPDDTLVYSSEFGESVSLESYLRSFPAASPTLFQTSIHPSGFQQGLVLRQRPVREALPLAGGPELVLQAALAAASCPAERVLWCGGEERGSWLRELGVAAERSFAFAVALGPAAQRNPLGRIILGPCEESGSMPLSLWADLLRDRRAWQGPVGAGWHLSLIWT